jgi:hypothetical protein
MLPTGLEVAARTKLAIEEMTKWAREEFNLPTFSVDFKLTRKSDRSWCKSTGLRGSMIQLGVQSLMTKQVNALVEYKSFNRYLEVGGFKTDDWRLQHDCIIAHEMSHAVQFLLRMDAIRAGQSRVEGLGYIERGHGSFFLAIYKRFRNKFINSRVPRSAYTNPRQFFVEEDRMEELNPNDPLKGVLVQFSTGKRFEVVGKDPTIRGIYCYRAKNLRTGEMTRLKLQDIVACSGNAVKERALQHPEALIMELAIAAVQRPRRVVRRRRYY